MAALKVANERQAALHKFIYYETTGAPKSKIATLYIVNYNAEVLQ